MSFSTSTDQHSAIGRLLDMLIKHGTMPNVPRPEIITNAQVELASMELQLAALTARLTAVERTLKAAQNYIDVNVCDCDTTSEMRQAWQAYQAALLSDRGTG